MENMVSLPWIFCPKASADHGHVNRRAGVRLARAMSGA